MRVQILLVLSLLLVPAAIAQAPVQGCVRQCDPKATDVNLPPVVEWGGAVHVIQYAHIEGLLSRHPLNTIPPNGSFEKDINKGFLMPNVRTRLLGTPTDISFDNNWFTFTHCPGTVEPTKEGWRNYCHSHGIGDSLTFAGRQVPVYFYVSPEGTPEPGRAGFAPNVQLHARMMSGSAGGQTLGESKPETTATTLIVRPGESDVFELRTMMELRVGSIDTRNGPGYRVEVGVFQQSDARAEFQQNFRVRSGPQFPPRIILPLLDPISVKDHIVRADNGTIDYFVRIVADLGAYDIDARSAKAGLRSGGVRLDQHVKPVRVEDWNKNDHSGATNPLMFHYEIDARSIQEPGPLIVEFQVANQQGTYIVHHAAELPFATFDGAETIPGLGLTGIVLLGLAMSVLRRRLEKP